MNLSRSVPAAIDTGRGQGDGPPGRRLMVRRDIPKHSASSGAVDFHSGPAIAF